MPAQEQLGGRTSEYLLEAKTTRVEQMKAQPEFSFGARLFRKLWYKHQCSIRRNGGAIVRAAANWCLECPVFVGLLHATTMTTRFSTIAKLIGGAVVVGASFATTLAVMDAYDGLTIWNEARRGAELRLHLYREACTSQIVGTLRCGVTYTAHYEPATNNWVVSGPSSSGLLTAAYNNAPNRAGYISVWGLVASYDQNGDLKAGNTLIGRLEIDRLSGLRYSLLGF